MRLGYWCRCVAAVVGWSTLALQLGLMVQSEGWVGLLKFWDYFTFLSTLLVYLVFTTASLPPGQVRFFAHPKVKSGIGVYSCLSALVYYLLLRQNWQPTGGWLVADLSFHVVLPTLYLVEWLWGTPKSGLQWRDAVRWLAFPLAFVVWALVWGALTGFYPYPFLNVSQLGYAAVCANSGLLAVGFLVLGLLVVALGRWLSRGTRQRLPPVPLAPARAQQRR